jgi:hypothetical protein
MLAYPHTVTPGLKIVKRLVIRGVGCIEPGELTRLAGSNVVRSPGSRSGARTILSPDRRGTRAAGPSHISGRAVQLTLL